MEPSGRNTPLRIAEYGGMKQMTSRTFRSKGRVATTQVTP